jgi:8-oxo-dGTP pyrophosphatase MutT (NUDIX family)
VNLPPPKSAAGCVIVARRTGRVLFCLRALTVPSGGVWGTWGGKSEGTETATQTALREVLEETGLAGVEDLLHLHRMRTGAFTYDTFVMVVEDEFCPTIGAEADGYAWLPIDRAPAPLHWGFAKLLSDRAACARLAREIERVSGRPCSLVAAAAPSRKPHERRREVPAEARADTAPADTPTPVAPATGGAAEPAKRGRRRNRRARGKQKGASPLPA